MNIDVLTLFPAWFEWFRSQRHVTNALERGHELSFVDLRATTPLKSGQVDDTPYGGGAGMVIRVDVVEAALRDRYDADPLELRRRRRVVALAPGGRQFDEALAQELAAEPALTLLCGRYEGFDERVHEQLASDVVSIGPYVLSGGELAAMVVCDAVIRKLPGALGHEESAARGVVQRGARGCARVPALHAPLRLARAHGPRGAPVGGPRAGARLASRAQPRTSTAATHPEVPESFATIAPHARRLPGGRAFLCLPTRTEATEPHSLMPGLIDSIERAQLRRVPAFQAGDRVRVHFQVVEGQRRRTQVFEGVVIKRQGSGVRETFTVRKQSFGVGVERTFPLHSPKIERIEVAARGDVRRAKLYYLRDRVGRASRVRERRWTGQPEQFETGAMPADDAPRPGEEELAEQVAVEQARQSRGGRRRGRGRARARRRGARG